MTTTELLGLTPKQRACLDAIEAHAEKKRIMPSLEELRTALGSGSRASVLNLLRQLEDRGAIARLPHRARAIRLLKQPAACPQCGAKLAEAAP